VLLSDHGPAFEANLFRAVCDELGIDKVYSTPYHPEANGQVEKQNRTVNQCLTALVNENRNNWDVLLPKVAFAFNTTSQATTRMSPFELVFHVAPRRIDSMLVPQTEGEEEEQDDLEKDPDYTPHAQRKCDQQAEMVRRSMRKWEKIYQDVRRRIKKRARENWARNRATSSKPFHPHVPGDRVRKRCHATVKGKLHKPIRSEIYIVRRKIGEVNYEIQRENDRQAAPEIIHHNQLVKVYKQILRYEQEESDDEIVPCDEDTIETPARNPVTRKSTRQRKPVDILQIQPFQKSYEN
jgi:hypothetical protein